MVKQKIIPPGLKQGDTVAVISPSFAIDEEKTGKATFFDVTVSDTTGRDRAVTLVYSIPVPAENSLWLQDPRQSLKVEANREYVNAGRFSAGANGRLSRYPFAALISGNQGIGIGINMAAPAFFRVGYNAASKELFIAR